MIGTLIFLVLGMILLAILLAILLLREEPEPPLASNGKQGGESPAILTALELNLPSRLLADCIFAQNDLDFVVREAPSLERSFLQERKKVALLWLRDTRVSISRLFQFYRIAVRSNAALRFWTEVRIAGYYCMFLLMVSGLQFLIYVRGPFYVRGMVMRMFGIADRVSVGVGRTLGAMDRSSLVRIRDDWARQATPAD